LENNEEKYVTRNRTSNMENQLTLTNLHPTERGAKYRSKRKLNEFPEFSAGGIK